MPNEVVKYKNNFLEVVKMDKMSPVAMDVFMVLIHKINGKGSKEVSVEYGQLRELTGYVHKGTNQEFQQIMDKEIFDNMTKTVIYFHDQDGASHYIPLFKHVKNDGENSLVKYCISEEMTEYFNDFFSDFTVIELKEYTSLKSKYSKLIYQKLKQFRKTGHFHQEYDKFCYDYLNIPKGYAKANIGTRIIHPAVKELKRLESFKSLKVSFKRQGCSYFMIFFDWDPEQEKRFVPPLVGDIPSSSMIDPTQKADKENTDAVRENILQQMENDRSYNNPFVSSDEPKKESDDDLPF